MTPRQSSSQSTTPPHKTDKPRDKQMDRPAGISHFPLQAEQGRQQEVPPRGSSKAGTKSSMGRALQGHRRSRVQGREALLDSEDSFEGKGGKGGKPGGSRAGLLASRKRPMR
jgi:hypothetical protein